MRSHCQSAFMILVELLTDDMTRYTSYHAVLPRNSLYIPSLLYSHVTNEKWLKCFELSMTRYTLHDRGAAFNVLYTGNFERSWTYRECIFFYDFSFERLLCRPTIFCSTALSLQYRTVFTPRRNAISLIIPNLNCSTCQQCNKTNTVLGDALDV